MKKELLVGVCLASISLLPQAAFAQESSGRADKAGASAPSNVIVVTAQKREQSLADIGAAISVLSDEELGFRDLSSADDIATSIPNLSYGEVAGAAQISIRGIGLNVETGFAEPAVAVHLNGVYLGRSNSAALGLADLANVEVLRGPQGTLYGRNATGGVVNFNTKKPTSELEAGLTLGAGSFNRLSANGYVSGPIADTLRARVSAEYKQDDGYLHNNTTGRTEGGVEALTFKGDLSWDATDSLTADLFYLYIDQKWDGPSFEKIVPGFLAGLAGFDPRPNNILNNVDPQSDIEMNVAGLTLNWETDNFTVRSITGYNTFRRVDLIDGDAMALDILRSSRDEDSTAWMQELNIIGTTGGTLDWIVGGFWMEEESLSRTDVDTGANAAILGAPPGISFTVNQLDEDVRALGLFADVTVNLSDSFRLKGGARYSDEKKRAGQTVTFFNGALALCNNQRSTISFNDITPKAGVEWDVASSTMVYGQYQQGFKSGGFNQAGCGSFEPEEVTSFEVGFKGQYWNDRVFIAASAFHYDYTNLQVLQVRNNTGFVENAADSTIYGLELEGKAALTDHLNIETSVSVLNATYDSFIDGTGADFSGNTLNRAPKTTVSAAIDYTIPIEQGILTDLHLRGEWFRSDDVFYRPRNAGDDKQESYSLINLYASLNLSDNFTISAFGKNVTNKKYLVNVISLIDGLDGHYSAPANWGVEVSARW